MRIEKDYEDLLKLFNKHKVRYCIIGAFAMAYYAKPRYTKDMDLFVDPELANSKRIVKALHDFGFAGLGLTAKDFCEKNRIIQLGYEPVRIDIITSISGCSFRQVWTNRKTGKYGRHKVNFISLNDLVKNKKASSRKQDKADLEILQKIKKTQDS